MTVRAGAAAAGAALVLLLMPASAWACDAVESLDPVEGYAGEAVSTALPAGCEDATWKASAGSHEFSGTGRSVAFDVPDLGVDASDVAVSVRVTPDEGDGWKSSFTLRYRGHRPAAPPPSPEPSPPTRSESPRGVPVPPIPARGEPSAGPPPSGGEVGGRRARGTTRPPALPRAVGRVLDRVADALTTPPRRGDPRVARRARRAAKRARDRAERTVDALPLVPLEQLGPAARGDDAGLPDALPTVGLRVAWRLMLAVLVGGLLLMLTMATFARGRERRARRDSELEAELQEILAEERALKRDRV